MFYTRIPVPKSIGDCSANLNRTTKYFPLIGVIVGGIGALIFIISNILFPVNISVLISIGAIVLITGAFHEDALADFCDGFGGGYDSSQILKIMKDSFIGVYGTLGLFFVLLAKFIILVEVGVNYIPIILIVAHAVSRFNPIILIFTSKYVGQQLNSKSKGIGDEKYKVDFIFAFIFGILPLTFLPLVYIPFIVFFLAIMLIYFRYYVRKKIGGYNGDVLGALQQFSELGVYFIFLLTNRLYEFICC